MNCPICEQAIEPVEGADVYHMDCLKSTIPKWFIIGRKKLAIPTPTWIERVGELRNNLQGADYKQRKVIVQEIHRLVGV